MTAMTKQRLLADATLNDGNRKVIDIHFTSEVWFFAGSVERIRRRDPVALKVVLKDPFIIGRRRACTVNSKHLSCAATSLIWPLA
jgi:hypothetical protein